MFTLLLRPHPRPTMPTSPYGVKALPAFDALPSSKPGESTDQSSLHDVFQCDVLNSWHGQVFRAWRQQLAS